MDVTRKRDGVEADLKAIINAHLEKIQKLEEPVVLDPVSTPSSSKKQRK